jgi:hypothetical protein
MNYLDGSQLSSTDASDSGNASHFRWISSSVTPGFLQFGYLKGVTITCRHPPLSILSSQQIYNELQSLHRGLDKLVLKTSPSTIWIYSKSFYFKDFYRDRPESPCHFTPCLLPEPPLLNSIWKSQNGYNLPTNLPLAPPMIFSSRRRFLLRRNRRNLLSRTCLRLLTITITIISAIVNPALKVWRAVLNAGNAVAVARLEWRLLCPPATIAGILSVRTAPSTDQKQAEVSVRPFSSPQWTLSQLTIPRPIRSQWGDLRSERRCAVGGWDWRVGGLEQWTASCCWRPCNSS